ncbi:MAG TPA: hypothetical protein ENF94_01690 [Candidatus Woesearchaeota archaeon]|nr:hypothetical protein [Candidatus Woesearchaeota archaeon]
MIIRTDLLKDALKILKKTTGSFIENPSLFLSSRDGRLFLKTQEAYLQTTVSLDSIGSILTVETLFNPFYQFIKHNHSKAIEIKANDTILQLTSLRTQEQLSLPARRITEDPFPPLYHNGLSLSIKELCRFLDIVTGTIGFSFEDGNIIVFSQKHLYGFIRNFMVRTPFPLNIEKSFISYETARRFVKTLKSLPDEKIAFFDGLHKCLKFENRTKSLKTVLFLKTAAFLENIPELPALQETFIVQREILVKHLKKLINVSGVFPATAQLSYDGLNLKISQNSCFTYTITLTTKPLKYHLDSISLFIKPLARFLSTQNAKTVTVLTGKDAWAIRLKESILVIFRQGGKG